MSSQGTYPEVYDRDKNSSTLYKYVNASIWNKKQGGASVLHKRKFNKNEFPVIYDHYFLVKTSQALEVCPWTGFIVKTIQLVTQTARVQLKLLYFAF